MTRLRCSWCCQAGTASPNTGSKDANCRLEQQELASIPPIWIMKITFAEQHTRHSRRQESIRLPVQEEAFRACAYSLQQ